jgi:hypothetical protein
LGISKIASKESNSGLQMNFFGECEKFWAKSALTFGNGFPRVSGSTDWTAALQHCGKQKAQGVKQTIVHWVIRESAPIWRCSSHRGTPSIRQLNHRVFCENKSRQRRS